MITILGGIAAALVVPTLAAGYLSIIIFPLLCLIGGIWMLLSQFQWPTWLSGSSQETRGRAHQELSPRP